MVGIWDLGVKADIWRKELFTELCPHAMNSVTQIELDFIKSLDITTNKEIDYPTRV